MKNGRDEKELGYMNILNYKLDKIEPKTPKDEKFGFRISHNNIYCELYARN